MMVYRGKYGVALKVGLWHFAYHGDILWLKPRLGRYPDGFSFVWLRFEIGRVYPLKVAG